MYMAVAESPEFSRRAQYLLTEEEIDELIEFNAFATAFGISLTTLQRWEKGEQSPRGPALILLKLLQKEPRTFHKALSIEP